MKNFFSKHNFEHFKKTRFWRHKLIMVLVAIAMLAVVVFYTGLRAAIVAIFSNNPISHDVAVGGIVIENGILRDEFTDGRVLEIKSAISRNDANNTDLIFFNDLSGRLLRAKKDGKKDDSTPDQNMAMLPSDSLAIDELMNFKTSIGILTTKQNTLLMEKDVNVNLANGLHITTSNLNVDFRLNEIRGDAMVYGKGEGEEFSGEGIIIYNQGQNIKLLGQSQMTIFTAPQK
ncbi:MAG: LPS export ABC transporter periplasmic protein LptC [Alphaproteobacteria bacterium]